MNLNHSHIWSRWKTFPISYPRIQVPELYLSILMFWKNIGSYLTISIEQCNDTPDSKRFCWNLKPAYSRLQVQNQTFVYLVKFCMTRCLDFTTLHKYNSDHPSKPWEEDGTRNNLQIKVVGPSMTLLQIIYERSSTE